MSENVLFSLPATMEEALWTLPPISQYLENRLVMTEAIRDNVSGFTIPARKPVGRIAIVCPLEEIHPLLKTCWLNLEITKEITDEQREMADICIEFNPGISYDLTKRVTKHITEAYGIQIGALPMMILPAIAQRIVREEMGSILVLGRYRYDAHRPTWVWPHQAEFIKMGTENGLSVTHLPQEHSYSDLARAVSRASVVVGVRSTGTLLAACFRKVVMELSPEGYEHKHWMEKWENRTYRMIHGDLNDMTAWFVWDRTNKLVKSLMDTRGPELWVDPHSMSSAEDLVTAGR